MARRPGSPAPGRPAPARAPEQRRSPPRPAPRRRIQPTAPPAPRHPARQPAACLGDHHPVESPAQARPIIETARRQPDAGRLPGQWLRIRVIDTGRGIAPESLSKLFTPFERLDAAQAGFEGTGLGLALSRHLIESMGGTLDVSSLPGKGSTFWLDLPTVNPATVDQADSQAAAEDAHLLALRGYPSPKRVLYVEDMVENVHLVEEILTHRPSITLIPAMLAGVALDLAREHRPDLILLDLHLPDMPGDKLLALLRAEPATRDIPVVVLSADATQHHIDQLHTAGVCAYLTKPIAVRDLLRSIDALLGEPTNDQHTSQSQQHVQPQTPAANNPTATDHET